MTLKDWLFETGDFANPYYPGQWKFLHILTLVICISLIIGFYFIVKYSKNKEKTKTIIITTLVSIIAFFELASRIVYCVRLYYYHVPDMEGLDLIWIILPKPWCAISCWTLIASVIVKKKFFYNYASSTALLCSLIFFAYPGVGFNNEYIMFSNLYSIVTHALLLTTSISLITLKFTDFNYKDIWKVIICYIITYIYGLLEIFVLKIFKDPMYFMPGGDIQAGILGIPWVLYIILYILLIIVFINSFYLIRLIKDKIKKTKSNS